ncbi:MAG: hypothetical protein U0Q16_15635 [Bryobacteraceae bacterium]
MPVRIALIGDYDSRVTAHQAIPLALERAKSHILPRDLDFEWKHTSAIGPLDGYHGVWCVPASPYASEQSAIDAIRWARERFVPFLGTCGGFQHAVLEFARNVLGLAGAAHEETAQDTTSLVIARLSCSLVEVEQPVVAISGTQLAEAYGTEPVHFGYHCNFGLNHAFEERLQRAGMCISARDPQGEVRAMELAGHPFFVGTLFQPERWALRGRNCPIADAFVRAAARYADARG